MQKIHAWIYNPDHALFKSSSKRAALFELHCDDPSECELYTRCNTCLLQGGMGGCKFGRKTKKDGPTKRAQKYGAWMAKAREDNKEYFSRLSTTNKYSGISKIHDHWHLPYSFMHGISGNGYPLSSEWVSEDDMTAELLGKICAARPQAMMGGFISKYQKDIVPKFIHDLKTHHPELFALLPDERRAQAESFSFIGRKADIKTCAPGTYWIKNDKWEWDGSKLVGRKMLFQPLEGKIRIEIEPGDSQPVEITADNQVTSETVFLD